MFLDPVLERFVEKRPVAVMARLVAQRALDDEWVDRVFEKHAERQYTRELLFSSVFQLMSVVATGLRPSLHAAVQSHPVSVSLAALYEKANHAEPAVLRQLVLGSATRLVPVQEPFCKHRRALLPGYRLRLVDGNHLPASEKRLKPLRKFRGSALPGQMLVVYDPDLDLVVDLQPGEDAHAHELSLLAQVLPRFEAGDVMVADRNFCTTQVFMKLKELVPSSRGFPSTYRS